MILCVGGDFGEYGKPSGLFKKLTVSIQSHTDQEVKVLNGGTMDELKRAIAEYNYADIVLWFANVDNSEEKIIHDIKKFNRSTMLVTSKRNHNEYTFQDLVAHALSVKANLTVSFTREMGGVFSMTLFDPLGNVWVDNTIDIDDVAKGIVDRAMQLSFYTRNGAAWDGESGDVPEDKEFFSYIRNSAEVFHKLIAPAGTTRFLGNASFRCTKGGFPSMKKNGRVYVSRRNIDKSDIGANGFVPALLNGKSIEYSGYHKPSVDTPIQLRLYKYYHNAKYMIHSHVYVKDAEYTTSECIPCGAVEEFFSIVWAIKDRSAVNFAINLKGHGSLIVVDDVKKFKDFKFISRPIPEIQ